MVWCGEVWYCIVLYGKVAATIGWCISQKSNPDINVVVAWPSGLRRWFKAPVSPGAWVRIPPLPVFFFYFIFITNRELLLQFHMLFIS